MSWLVPSPASLKATTRFTPFRWALAEMKCGLVARAGDAIAAISSTGAHRTISSRFIARFMGKVPSRSRTIKIEDDWECSNDYTALHLPVRGIAQRSSWLGPSYEIDLPGRGALAHADVAAAFPCRA